MGLIAHLSQKEHDELLSDDSRSEPRGYQYHLKFARLNLQSRAESNDVTHNHERAESVHTFQDGSGCATAAAGYASSIRLDGLKEAYYSPPPLSGYGGMTGQVHMPPV